MAYVQQEQCPIDRRQCFYWECEIHCAKLKSGANDYTAEARHIGSGLAIMGFWIGLGILLAAIIP